MRLASNLWILLSGPSPRTARSQTEMIYGARFVIRTGAVCAAVEFCRCFYPMPDDPTPAMAAYGCQTVDRAFEAVEDVRFTADSHFERQMIVVTANLADGHGRPPVLGVQRSLAPGSWTRPFVIRQPLTVAAQPAKVERIVSCFGIDCSRTRNFLATMTACDQRRCLGREMLAPIRVVNRRWFG